MKKKKKKKKKRKEPSCVDAGVKEDHREIESEEVEQESTLGGEGEGVVLGQEMGEEEEGEGEEFDVGVSDFFQVLARWREEGGFRFSIALPCWFFLFFVKEVVFFFLFFFVFFCFFFNDGYMSKKKRTIPRSKNQKKKTKRKRKEEQTNPHKQKFFTTNTNTSTSEQNFFFFFFLFVIQFLFSPKPMTWHSRAQCVSPAPWIFSSHSLLFKFFKSECWRTLLLNSSPPRGKTSNNNNNNKKLRGSNKATHLKGHRATLPIFHKTTKKKN